MSDWSVDDNGISQWSGAVRTLFLTVGGGTQLLCIDQPVTLPQGAVVKITTPNEATHTKYTVQAVEFEAFHNGAGPFVMVYLRECTAARPIA